MTLSLFEKFGIELEYMIVRRRDHCVAPLADRIMIAQCGEPTSDCSVGPCEVSNELAAHVIELKTPAPTADLVQLERDFVESVALTNAILDHHGCELLPGPMHPTMDPSRESNTWPHGNREIYGTYDRIFNCRGHGWFNLQSCHINLPFKGDDEFAWLHSAILLVLPLLPALTAASPFKEGRVTGLLDTRVDTYRLNQARCPWIAGEIVPEAVFSQQEYHDTILAPMFAQIAPLDPEGLLQHEWLNSRGAIARFERSAIEIRLLDVQECPGADLALASLIIETIRHLVEHRSEKLRAYAIAGTPAHRKGQLMDVVRDGLAAPLRMPELREAFALSSEVETVGDFWWAVFETLALPNLSAAQRETVSTILTRGNLATRQLEWLRLRGGCNRPDFTSLCAALAGCLRENCLLLPE